MPGDAPPPVGPPPGPAPTWAAPVVPGPKRRWWLIALSAVWVVALVALSFWSVRRDEPTVAEQRSVAEAVPVVQRAVGVLVAAADRATDRALVIDGIRFDDCEITPVRSGTEATRDLLVHVPAGRALAVLEELAAALPADYRAEAGSSTAGKRIGLHADAGEFVGIDAEADADARVLTLRVSTGCRPSDGDEPIEEPRPGAPPGVLTELLGPAVSPEVQAVTCPDGTVAATYTVEGAAAPEDPGRSVPRGATVIRAERGEWVARTPAGVSVVVADSGGPVRVDVTTPC